MKLTLRFKGGKGSGHFGHRGRPGKQGGGLPEGGPAIDANYVEGDLDENGNQVGFKFPADTPTMQLTDAKLTSPEDVDAFNKLVNMFEVNKIVNKLKDDVSMANDSVNRYDKLWRRSQTDGNNKMRIDSYNKLDEAKKKLDDARKELKIASKDVKAPGYGEWKKTSKDKAMAGSWTHYSHPDHPEWGSVGIYKFEGWSMQRVAASSTVEYNGSKFNWSGSNARSSADAFVRSVFGIG